MIWTFDLCIFFTFILWGFLYPRNEWMGNSFIVLVFTIIALWYQPVIPELLGGQDMAGMKYPFHRLFGFFGVVAVAWSFIEQYEDLKTWWKDRREN